MPRYLLSIYQPDGPPPAQEALDRIMRNVHAVRAEMTAAGAWILAGGLQPAKTATVVRAEPHGASIVTDGPFAETKEQLGGFSIIQTRDRAAAVEWARR